MSRVVCVQTPPTPPSKRGENAAAGAGAATARRHNTPKSSAGHKPTDKVKPASTAISAIIGACGRLAMDAISISANPAEVWTLSFRAVGDGPPVALRIRALLKRAIRSHGLRCIEHRITTPAGRAMPATAVVEATR